MSPKRPKGRPYLEVQIHPADIRRGVWCLFFSRRQLSWMAAAAVALIVFLLAGLALTPKVVQWSVERHQYRSLVAERRNLGKRLKRLTVELASLKSSTDVLRSKVGQIYLVYGLTGKESEGQGGYPFEPAPVPRSIYSDVILQGNRLVAGASEEIKAINVLSSEVEDFEKAHRKEVRTTPSACPLHGGDFVLTSPFGTRRNPFTKGIDFHAGIDLAAPRGDGIYAPADGVVVFAGRYPLRQSVGWWRYGNLVAIRHGNRFITLYGHCQKVLVRGGQHVHQGELIARVGSTGWSTNPHLHYEVRRREANGKFEPVDPRIYILDHRWGPGERLLVATRRAPDESNYEPLPRLFGR